MSILNSSFLIFITYGTYAENTEPTWGLFVSLMFFTHKPILTKQDICCRLHLWFLENKKLHATEPPKIAESGLAGCAGW